MPKVIGFFSMCLEIALLAERFGNDALALEFNDQWVGVDLAQLVCAAVCDGAQGVVKVRCAQAYALFTGCFEQFKDGFGLRDRRSGAFDLKPVFTADDFDSEEALSFFEVTGVVGV